jgi:DNA-binding transcriptional LysR family regulator
MDLLHLRHFAAVCAHGSLSAAANVLGLSQPGLTKSVRRLEEALGTRLLLRRPRGVEPTEAGRRLLAHARMIELQLADARHELAALSRGGAGAIAVGAGPSWLAARLPLVIGRLLARDAGLRIRVVGGFNDRLLHDLDEGRLDLVLAAFPEAALPERYRGIVLSADVLQVVAREGHPLARRRGLAPADLAGCGWALPGRNVASRARLDALFVTHGLAPPEPVVESDAIAFIMATVRATDLLSFATSDHDAAGIAPLPLRGFAVRRETGIILHARRVVAAPVQALVDELRATCGAVRPG